MSRGGDTSRRDEAARSFRPKDFGFRDLPRIVAGLLGFGLVIPGGLMLIDGDDRWRWALGVGGPCLILSVVLSAMKARREFAKPESGSVRHEESGRVGS